MNKKDFFTKIKKINNFELKTVFAKNYVFEKQPFRIAMSLTFLLFIAVLSIYGFDLKDNFYYNCPQEFDLCYNNFYQKPDCQGNKDFCNTEFFEGGYSIGEPQPKVIKNFFLIPLVLFGVAFLRNHLKYNRGVKP